MKAVALPTSTLNCMSLWKSYQSLGHEVIAIVADDKNDAQQHELVEQVRAIAPDFIVFFGAVQEHYHRRMLTIDSLRALKSIAPLIHFCCDGGDLPWHAWLRRYAEAGCFSLQVNLDGCEAPECMTTLTPFDNASFSPLPWEQRDIRFGMVCSSTGNGDRHSFIEAMRAHHGLQVSVTNMTWSYDDFARTMCRMKIVFNHGMRGTQQGQHVKGRVIEAGYSGSVLLDHVDSPTKKWLVPGVEYLAYNTVEDVGRFLQLPDDALQESARRLSERIYRDYSPPVLWDRILERAGVVAA